MTKRFFLALLIGSFVIGAAVGQVGYPQATAAPVTRGIVVLTPIGGSHAAGRVYFTPSGTAMKVTGTIIGLTPGMHGIHVHTYGDLTDQSKGASAGSHYNPTNMPHGRPQDRRRHVGDMGNITANAQGRSYFAVTIPRMSLNGRYGIIGRGLVIHSGADKFTQPDGNAGARVAFGVIGYANPTTK